MEYATILPDAYLHLVENDNYHMALAHRIQPNHINDAYTNFFKRQGAREGSYVILDNGVIEGDPRSIDEIIAKARSIGADEIILPDKLMDCDATLEMSYEALLVAKSIAPELKIMAVPQGEDLEEWLSCANIMLDWDINCIGIPKVLTKLGGRDGRLEALRAMGRRFRGLDIHLLGCWESPLELVLIQKYADKLHIQPVRGVDSVIAYVYAREGLSISQASRPSGAVDFAAHDASEELLVSNIAIWKGMSNRDGNIRHII